MMRSAIIHDAELGLALWKAVPAGSWEPFYIQGSSFPRDRADDDPRAACYHSKSHLMKPIVPSPCLHLA